MLILEPPTLVRTSSIASDSNDHPSDRDQKGSSKEKSPVKIATTPKQTENKSQNSSSTKSPKKGKSKISDDYSKSEEKEQKVGLLK